MSAYMHVFLCILLGFLSGSVLYCRLLPLWLCKKDICALSDDKNPGAANVFIHCGVPMGLLCLVLDMAKGGLPVAFALRLLDPMRISFAAVMTAPVLGHALGLFNHGRGGKCIAAIFGVLIALLGITPMGWILAGIYIFFAGILRVKPNSKCSILTFSLFACVSIFIGIRTGKYAIALGCVLLSVISICKHAKAVSCEPPVPDAAPDTEESEV